MVEKKIKSSIIYEDKEFIVIKDINPKAKYHVLIIPKEHLSDLYFAQSTLLLEINKIILNLINKEKLMGKGYRLVINGGGAQAILHLHIHLLGLISKDRAV